MNLPQRRLRVAYVQSHPFYGSTERYLRQLIMGLDSSRFEPWLIYPDTERLTSLRGVVPAERAVAVPVHAVGGRVLPWFVRTRSRALRGVAPDLVHCSDFDPPAILASRLAGVGVVVVTYNTPELRPRYNLIGRAVTRMAWGLQPWAILTSEADRRTALARDSLRADRAVVIPFGLDLQRLQPEEREAARRKLGLPAGLPIIGTVGLLREQKGHLYLLEAVHHLLRTRPNLLVLIAGEGEMRPKLEHEIRSRGLMGAVRLLGFRDDVPTILSALDVFVLSSTFEGMCLAVAEALAVGVPVVATDVGGVSQSVVHRETGLLVPPRRSEELAVAVGELLDDREGAQRLGEAGRARVTRLYRPAMMLERTQDLYLRAVRGAS